MDVKTKDIVHTQISRFYPDDKIAGKGSFLQTPLRRRKKRESEAPDNFALLKMEFERLRVVPPGDPPCHPCMEETTCDRPAYRDALAKMQDLLISASRISELIFPARPCITSVPRIPRTGRTEPCTGCGSPTRSKRPNSYSSSAGGRRQNNSPPFSTWSSNETANGLRRHLQASTR